MTTALPPVVADYWRNSYPGHVDGSLRRDLAPVLEAAGFHQSSVDMWRHVAYPTANVLHHEKRGTMVLSASGKALAALRAHGLLERFAWTVQVYPHTPTALHTCHDVATHAPPLIAAARLAAFNGTLRLSRKALAERDILLLARLNPQGEDTGTLYLGSMNATRQLCIYDKRNERLQAGDDDPGPLIRYELKHKREAGMTLRDLCRPDAIHWAHMPEAAYPHPPVTWKRLERVPWHQHHASTLTDAERLRRLVESSPDVHRALTLAASLGPHGLSYLHSCLDRLAQPSPLGSGSAKPSGATAHGGATADAPAPPSRLN